MKDKPREGTVYSQPKDTGVGRHWATQLLYAVGFLKQHAHPIRLEDLAIRSNVEGLMTNVELLESFKAHERVLYDEKTGLYRYKPDYNIKSSADLLSIVRRYAPRGGMPVKVLKESWPGVGPAIEELEQEGRILVTRTGGTNDREGQMKTVFYDEVGIIDPVDEEFRTLWSSLKTPDAVTLASDLKSAGLTTATAVQSTVPTQQKKKKGRKGPGSHNRRHKFTNVHLKGTGIDLTKDYVPVKK